MTLARRKPAIVITRHDHEQLTKLADSFALSQPALTEELYNELDRARIVAGHKAGADFVRIGSTFRFTTDGGDDRTVTLVLPGEADIAEGKVSIMTPIGVALIGLSAGELMKWTARDGRTHTLTVVSVGADSMGKAGAVA